MNASNHIKQNEKKSFKKRKNEELELVKKDQENEIKRKKLNSKPPQKSVSSKNFKNITSVKNEANSNGPNQNVNSNSFQNKLTPSTVKLSPMQIQFVKKLEGARFRTINEELYSTTGENAFGDFQKDPSKFEIYHKGYREQAAQWPCNPLDSIIDWIKKDHKGKVIVDMGCGDAKLAASLSNTVHSFDLVAANDSVIACNMANVPLPDASADIVVFCLSLMGTNINEFLAEAHRILKINGIIKIVEVRSRLDDNSGIKKFCSYLKRLGFVIKPFNKEFENKMFFEVECTKVSESINSSINFNFKVCQYKKR